MSNPIQSSAVTQQLAVLNEALEDQKISPCLEIDLKCAVEMKKLLTLVEETEKTTGALEDIGLDKVYTVLENNKESYSQGLERLNCESFATRFFHLFSKAPWEVGETACSQLLGKGEIFAKLNKWVSEAEPGEDRLEAKARILTCLKEKSSSLDLEGLSLNALPDVFDNLTFLTELNAGRNQLTALPESIGNLNLLTSLNTSCNQLTALPESIGNLKRLSSLELGLNPLAVYPEIISSLTSLESLGLWATHLTALPERIGNLKLLTSLDASDNQLTALPESIGNLKLLTSLSVSYNQLTALPESIGNLKRLSSLSLDSNPLTVYPEIISSFTSLHRLSLQNTHLTALPESIGNLRALTHLNITCNQLTALPESIGNLRLLTGLDTSSNQLTALPESIGNLRALQWLYVRGNQLTALPESIGNLIALEHLMVSHNSTLTGISNGVLDLQPACRIDLTRCGLSQTVLGNLQAAVAAPNYHGPRIHHSVLEPLHEGVQRSLPDLLQDLTAITGKALALPDIQNSAEQEGLLRMWLSRLCDLADYKTGGEKKIGLANNVQDYLQKANDDPAFREVFYPIIQGAAETCGDRVALSLVHLGIAYDLSKVDVRDMKKLANFLIRGVFVMGLLEDAARTKVASLRFVDEIEVYLGYPVMLKEKLHLPINTDQMLYARCSNITKQDLTAVTSFVNEQIGNEDIICNFLVNQDKWKEALKENHPEKMNELKAQKDISLENASSSADYAAIKSRFNAGLVELTRRVL